MNILEVASLVFTGAVGVMLGFAAVVAFIVVIRVGLENIEFILKWLKAKIDE